MKYIVIWLGEDGDLHYDEYEGLVGAKMAVIRHGCKAYIIGVEGPYDLLDCT